jgi:2-polyprenyl-3-methyl-5-hydroxy-6-metoxy-1,4-benzoquinol methylase
MKIQPENTAITTGVSKSAVELEKQSHKEDKILDYGSGKFRNSKYLKEKGLHISVLDTDFQIQKAKEDDLSEYEDVFVLETYEPQSNYDSVLCSFVLNVIPEKEEREEALKKIYDSLKKDGKLFLEVRGKSGILKNKFKEPYKDGYVVGKNEIKTFQKPFEKEEVTNLLKDKFEIEKIQSLSDSVLAIAKKK